MLHDTKRQGAFFCVVLSFLLKKRESKKKRDSLDNLESLLVGEFFKG